MKKTCIFTCLLYALTLNAQPLEKFPQAEITNGIIHARLLLPDIEEGYYRGSRFDWSGVIASLEYKGHSYFGKWFERYSPVLHDAIMGPVDDFQPIGYNEAKPGEHFLKIGIGIVTKPEEPKYSIGTPYKISNPGSWKVKKKSHQVEFTQKLDDKEYAYEYKKKVLLIRGKPEMVLTHSLKNTGRQAIETTVYNHNFFVIDSQLTGTNFSVRFPFTLSAEVQQKGDIGKIEGNQIIFLKDLAKNEHLFFNPLKGYSDNAKDYDIRVENHKTGAAVRITCDRPLARLMFWSAIKTVCPEPFIQLNVKPGETFTWNISYQFYTVDIIN